MSFLEDITLVIVNYNSRNVILNSLAPLKTLKNIIVVDNCVNSYGIKKFFIYKFNPYYALIWR